METTGLPLVALCLSVASASGCALSHSTIDVSVVESALAGFQDYQERYPLEQPDRVEPAKPPERGSVFIGELLAVFPGIFWPGLGHTYAGDHRTGARLRRVGEFGLIMTVVGGAAGVGAYYANENDLTGLSYGLYGTGGTLALIGVTYWMTAWIYDMIDTPRAVKSGGQPPPRSRFIEGLDIFD